MSVSLPFGQLSVRKFWSGLEGDTYGSAGIQLARGDDWSWQKRRGIPRKPMKTDRWKWLAQKAVCITERTQDAPASQDGQVTE